VTLLRPSSAPARLAAAFAAFTAAWFVWSYLAAGQVTDSAARWVSAALYDGSAAALVLVALVAALRRRQRVWLLVAVALAGFAAGDLLWDLSDLGVVPLPGTMPSVLDALYLPAYAATLGGIGYLLLRYAAPEGGRVLEACITGGGAAAAALPFVLRAEVDDFGTGSSAHEVVHGVYLACGLLLAAALAMAALSPSAPAAVRLIGVAAGVCLVADQLLGVRAPGNAGAPPWLDWLRLAQYVLTVAAVLAVRREEPAEAPEVAAEAGVPAGAAPGAPGTPDPGTLLMRRVTVLVACALLSSVLFAVTHFTTLAGARQERTESMYVVAMLLLVVLVCTRLVQLLNENAATVRDLRDALAEREQLSSDLVHQQRHDAVTGLPNRYQLADQAEAVLEADFVLETVLDGADTSHAVVFVDLDDFKAVNDTLGHTVGDRVLREIALRLKRVCRPDDIVARLGGDEFAVLIPGRGTEEAAETARSMIRVLAEPVVVGGRRITLGASAGVAQMHRGHGKYADALAEADVAMYAAKRAGKNRVAVFAENMRRDLLGDASLAADLQRALRDRALSVAYQPLVHLATGRTEGLEALARWRHPERGDLSPAVFLPVATERGLVPELDMQILDLALDQATVWRHMAPDLFVGVNAAAATLAHEAFTSTVLQKLDRAGLPGDALVVEVTEQSIIDDVPGAAAKLDELRRHGIAIALDDFGTGYSSLSALQDLPVDKLKLDRSFLARGVSHGVISPLLRTVVTLGHELGMTVVAEGIETQEHFEAMRELGCDIGQGWLLARPMPAEDVFRHLSTPSVATPAI
jgi:diguanylate cyclase (GGDEF)-like protein